MECYPSRNWHHFSVEQVTAELQTDGEKGISDQEAQERRERCGPNQLAQKAGQSLFTLFLNQFRQPLVYILLAAALGTGLLKEWVDMGVILAVVIVNGVIGFLQESKAIKAIEALSRAGDVEATVLRGGSKKRIPARMLAPGDMVVLQSGDKVPADLRLVKNRELQVDESALTGESVPVQKSKDAQPADTVLGDRRSMAYSSTLVTYGTAFGVVVEIGDRTEIGKINTMISSAEILATPLTRKIASLSHALLYVIMFISALVFIAGILRGHPLNEAFMSMVALAVGAIPEGLPAVVTITLAIGVSTMAQRQAIIRKLPAVETLGSTTVICSDKTGTLTQNAMLVQEVHTNGRTYGFTGIGYSGEGVISLNGEPLDTLPEDLREILLAGLLCNDSRLVRGEDGTIVEGDPTEGALLASAAKAGLSPEEAEKDFPRKDAIPFESQYQYMATLNSVGNGRVIFAKGSVEAILARCERDASGKTPDAAAIEGVVAGMARKGLRVLCFAKKPMDAGQEGISHDDLSKGLVFLGLQGMIDPPRPEAIEAVAACQQAGIRVKMITGDHVITASAIAAELDLKGLSDESGSPKGLSGKELSDLSDEEMEEAAEKYSVFARVSPEQKLRLVKSLQARGHIVAMTGDGVNDAPALRQADIGVAMGITGTEVSKEAADMILTDDNFASIRKAVEEGRRVYDNLIKFITWTLPTNLSEALVILVAAVLGLQLPVSPLQILWINMTTAIMLGSTLAFEKNEPGVMERPPRPPKAPILDNRLIFRVIYIGSLICFFAYVVFTLSRGRAADIPASRTLAVNMIVFGEIAFLLCCRSLHHSLFKLGLFSNLWLVGGILAMVGAQLLFTYAPFMNHLFGTAPVGRRGWLLIVAASLIIYAIGELEKWLARNAEKGPTATEQLSN